jgi:hypothetical protein
MTSVFAKGGLGGGVDEGEKSTGDEDRATEPIRSTECC